MKSAQRETRTSPDRFLTPLGAKFQNFFDQFVCRHIWSVKADGSIEELTIHPSDFGLAAHPIESVAGSTPDVNSATFHRILSGEEKGPVLDFLLMNSAAALYLVGKAVDLKDAVKQCRHAIDSGAVKKLVGDYITATHAAQ
jgi:anthranilate phosphoribosyltransferase